MPAFICVTCGVQHGPSEAPPTRCPICDDERQYVGWAGQRWTTLEALRAAGHRNELQELEDGLTAIHTQPKVAIGQRALFLRTPNGNILWDCITHLDDDTVRALSARGGLQAIAISHPHYYGTCVEWSDAFGGVPIYIHAADRQWVQRPAPQVVLWEGETIEPIPGLLLVRLGGHFNGAAVLYWPAGAGCQGVVLSGDTIQVVTDRRWVSFMYSYPNLIPLSAAEVEGIAATMKRYPHARLYGAFPGLNALEGGADAVERSARRYVAYLRGRQAQRS
jgi:hypothetical protein